jgi:hypothetical protein
MLAQGLIDLGYKVEYSCFFNIFISLLLCQCLAVNGSCLFLNLSAPISRLLLRLTDKWVYCVVTGAFFSLKGAIFAGCNWRNGQSPGACGSQVLAGESNRQQRWFLQRPNSWTKSRQKSEEFPPCNSQSPLTALPWDVYFFISLSYVFLFKITEPLMYFYSSVTEHCKGERRKTW